MEQAGSSRDPQSRGPALQASYSQAGASGEEDTETEALVFFPMEVGETMLTTHYAQVLSKFATDGARAKARQHICQLRNAFGVRFAKAPRAKDFVAAFKHVGYKVNNPATGEVYVLDKELASPSPPARARAMELEGLQGVGGQARQEEHQAEAQRREG